MCKHPIQSNIDIKRTICVLSYKYIPRARQESAENMVLLFVVTVTRKVNQQSKHTYISSTDIFV